MSRRLMLIAATWAALVGAGASLVDAQSMTPVGTQFMLTGVVFVEGGAGRAWLQEPTLTQNQVVSVRPGESIGPYRLKKILEDRVELEGPTGTFSVLLAGASGPATAAASPSLVPQAPAPGSGAAPQAPMAIVKQLPPGYSAPPPVTTFPPEVIVIPPGDLRRKFDFGSLESLFKGGGR